MFHSAEQVIMRRLWEGFGSMTLTGPYLWLSRQLSYFFPLLPLPLLSTKPQDLPFPLDDTNRFSKDGNSIEYLSVYMYIGIFSVRLLYIYLFGCAGSQPRHAGPLIFVVTCKLLVVTRRIQFSDQVPKSGSCIGS